MDQIIPPFLRQWLGSERVEGAGMAYATTISAAYICACCQVQCATAQGTEPVTRKERSYVNGQFRPLEEVELQKWARSSGLWIADSTLASLPESEIGRGVEQRVFLENSGRTVVKANTGSYHSNWLEFFLRLWAHRVLFPTTQYEIVRLTMLDNQLCILTRQQYFPYPVGADQEDVE